MSGIEQADNSVDYNLQNLDGEYNFNYTMQYLSEAQNSKEKNNKYTLSHTDFQNYFEGDEFEQSNLGNCWIVAALDSITHLSNYEDLVRRSVTLKKENGKIVGFDIRLPMGAPDGYEYADVYHTRINSAKQISIDGSSLNLLQGKNETNKDADPKDKPKLKEGFPCLLHAVAQSITGMKGYDKEFSFTKLTYGPTGSLVPFETFIYGFSGATYLKPQKFDAPLGKVFVDNLKFHLKNFNPQNESMTVIVPTDDDYNIITQGEATYIQGVSGRSADHVVSVDSVEEIDGELMVFISDPHSARKKWEGKDGVYKNGIPFKDFVRMIGGYTIAKDDEKKYLSGGGGTAVQKLWTNYIAVGAGGALHHNETIGSSVERQFTSPNPVNMVISLLTTTMQREERGDVTVHELDEKTGCGSKKDLEVSGWGEKARIIDNGDYVGITIRGKSLSLSKNSFIEKSKTIYGGTKHETNVEDYYYYYSACRVALFIERMVHERINTQSGAERSPFYLNGKGDINYRDKPDTILEEWYRNINPLTLLSSSAFKQSLGIEDGKAKQKIVNFLNDLYGGR